MLTQPQSTVYILDSDTSLCGRLKELLTSVGLPVETSQMPDEFLARPREIDAGCLLLGVRLSRMSGLTFYRRLREEGDSIPVIFLAKDADVETAVEAMREGAFDFLQVPVRDQCLLDCIDVALQQSDRDRQRHAERRASAARFRGLSPKEREVLDLMMQGQTNKAIAWRLRVSCKTLSFHRSNIMRKADVETIAELAYHYFVGKLHLEGSLPPSGNNDTPPAERLAPPAPSHVKPRPVLAACRTS